MFSLITRWFAVAQTSLARPQDATELPVDLVEPTVRRIVYDSLRKITSQPITDRSRLTKDLLLDSLELVELAMDIEDQFLEDGWSIQLEDVDSRINEFTVFELMWAIQQKLNSL